VDKFRDAKLQLDKDLHSFLVDTHAAEEDMLQRMEDTGNPHPVSLHTPRKRIE
jgi:hypothetical protein